MIEAIRNAFKVPDLRRRILFTFGILAIYRFGAHVPVPGVDVSVIRELFKQGGILGFMDLFAGGALSEFAVFALGIMPYITAAIIMELLTVVIPKVEEWAKEGEIGRRKITQWTRYLTLFLCLVQSIGLTFFFQGQLKIVFPLFTKFLIVITLTTGAIIIMWLGELITQKGIGNGMSLLIFISIISRFPQASIETFQIVNPLLIILLVFIILAMIAAIIFTESGQRRIPVQYAKRIVGRRIYGGQSTYIPLKINSAGVIPIIFAASVLLFPATLARFFPGKFFKVLAETLNPTSPFYLSLFALFIIFFTYFYTAIIFNPIDISDNIKKYGGFIPGVRPGKPTASYLDRILSRITFPGSLFLALIAVLPTIFMAQLNIPFFKEFGGISILIIVGVALETVRQVETHLIMRHYEGFLK
ncbi:MAG: preprotein translocase subunit SecY [Actinomycetota bacterium]|nr:preprotein translocase subunit SecY [Actinomycetota bacterium]